MAYFRWSVSRLLTYLRCPYQYFLKYREKPEVPAPWYLIFGGAVHKAIKVCHKGNPRQRFEPTPERPLFFKEAKAFGGFWCGLWEREVTKTEKESGIQWSKEGQKKKLKGLGWNMLAGTKDGKYRGYYNSISRPAFPINVLAIEAPIRVKLWEFPFIAVIDQIWQTPEGIAIVDLTTGRSLEVKFLQMTAYHLAFQEYCQTNPEARERFGEGASQHFVWNLRDEKLIPIEPQNPQALLEDLEYAAAGVQDGEFHETQQDDVCRHCEYKELCGKTTGQPISVANGASLQISLPQRPKKPQSRQLHFSKGAEGGWFRGKQVKGKTN